MHSGGRRFDPVWLHQPWWRNDDDANSVAFIHDTVSLTLETFSVGVLFDIVKSGYVLRIARSASNSVSLWNGERNRTYQKHEMVFLIGPFLPSMRVERTSIMRTIKCLKSIRWMPRR